MTYIPVANADVHAGGIITGGNRKVLYDATVATQDPEHDYTAFFDAATAKWVAATANTGASGYITFTKVTSTAQKPDKYYVVEDPLEGDFLGRTSAYRVPQVGGPILVSTSENYSYCTIGIIYERVNSKGYTDEGRIFAAVHEIGHTIKLAHPPGIEGSEGPKVRTNPLPTGERSIMGRMPAPELTVQNSPFPYDVADIVWRWSGRSN